MTRGDQAWYGDGSEAASLFVPIAGPFIFLETLKFPNESTGLEGLVVVPLILDGFIQAGGAILLTVGVILPKKVWVFGPWQGRSTMPRLAFTGDRIVFEGNF